MTLLLEGKESRAQKMMDQFQFTGDTPALYYAQAAWEFKHHNDAKANDWITSARKIYSQALNIIFADPFYDAGWLKTPAEEPASSLPAVAQNEPAASANGSPLIEPSPIPGTNSAEVTAPNQEVASVAPSTSPVISGMEATSAGSSVPAVAGAAAPSASIAIPPPAPPEKKAAAISQPIASKPKAAAAAPAEKKAAAPLMATAKALSTPATVLAPSRVREWTQPTIGESIYRLGDGHSVLVALLLISGLGILAWVIVPEVRHRLIPALSRRVTPATEPQFDVDDVSLNADKVDEVERPRFSARPPQRSIQLKATEPSVRRAVFPVGRPKHEIVHEPEPAPEEVAPAYVSPVISKAPEIVEAPVTPEVVEAPEAVEAAEVVREPEAVEPPVAVEPEPEPIGEATFAALEAMSVSSSDVEEEPEVELVAAEEFTEPEFEPVAQGWPVPHQTTVMESEPEPVAEAVPVVPEPPSVPKFVAPEPIVSQPTTPLMPETQTPIIRTAPTGGTPMPTTGGTPMPAAGGTQTAVQLTFSCEIASLQLTPSFKMGALQVKPISKVVMMRLSPSQHPQPAMNLQITFEVSSAQAAGGSLGTVRLTPSQQQKPGVITSPAFNISGVQLVSGSESAPVQLTPSHQGKASVHVTAAFQIASVEFSPSLEIASIVLNSSSRNVSVQLPGAGPSSIEGAPVFEITSVQMGNGGEIGLMQLSPPGSSAKR